MATEPRAGDAAGPELPEALIEELLERLDGTPPGDRAAVGDRFVAAHPQHTAALRRVLARMAAVERTLDRAFPEPDVEPEAIAGLPVVRRLGAGAFGVVYLCQQSVPVSRLVAVKVLRPGAGDRHTLARFAAEQQLLASWNHAATTQIYDAGHLADGRPFFVMEYVAGVPITVYCDDRHLPCRDRVRLFVDVCRGVAQAHASGVVHRDLKPGNVLVVEQNGRPQPKIIDFGIAKALARDAAAGGFATEGGRVLGTPGYMSPEQARGDTAAIDERTDVFGLGVLLFELLTGDLPWPRHATIATDAPLASRRLQRRAGTEGLDRRPPAATVRGDLDWITRKAIRIDRTERYASAQSLADDLERHLAGRPVSAGPPTWRYRTGKFVRRHRVAVGATGAAAVALVVGLHFAERRSTGAAERAAAATAAVEALLRRADALVAEQGTPNEPLRAALAADALGFYDRWLAERPDDAALRVGRCETLVMLSRVHWELGQPQAALQRATQAADEAAALAAIAPALPARAWRHRARALVLQQQPEAAIADGERAAAAFAALHAQDPGAHGLEFAAVLRELATALQSVGRRDDALQLHERSVAVLEGLAGTAAAAAARAELVSARFTQSFLLARLERLDEAVAALELAEAGLGHVTASPWRLAAVITMQRARLADQRRRLDEAAALHEQALASCEQWCEREPLQARARTLRRLCLEELAIVHGRRSDWPAADRAMQRTIDLAEAELAVAVEPAPVRQELRRQLYTFTRRLWDRFRRQDLPRAEAWLQRCIALTDPGDAARARPLAFEVAALAALLDEASGRPAATAWERLAPQLPTFAELADAEAAAQVVEAWLAIERSRLARGDTDGAAAALAGADAVAAVAGDLVDNAYRSDIAWHRARLRLALGDVAGCAEPLAEVRRRRPTWWGNHRIGICELAAWRHCVRTGDAAGGVRARTAAQQALQAVVESRGAAALQQPQDPWIVLPVGEAQLGLAEIEASLGNAAAARRLLEQGLAALDAIAADTHADQWDAAAVAAARRLLDELQRAAPR
ncbi:MAG: serine/threonine protein kinase [Planctomycetes bacterium]|nr:serine/threonine protein kinase [Planctomycetota bacterium]